MDQRRLRLQRKLRELLQSDEVHYVEPSSPSMVYPAIVYKRLNSAVKHADNNPYDIRKSYSLTVISRDVDDLIFDKIEALPLCTLNRTYQADQLQHYVFTLFF